MRGVESGHVTIGGEIEDLVINGVDVAPLVEAELDRREPERTKMPDHEARHRFGDTRHRLVTYRFRATTRFREYFHPSLLAPTHDGDDGQSTVSAAVEVDMSSAPPAAPVVHSVIPLFRWDGGEEEDGVTGDWRVVVEEWERLPGDVLAPREAGPLARNRPTLEQRLVFADEVLL